MSELRRNPTDNRWVIIAPKRGHRPHEVQSQLSPSVQALPFDPTCPFCPGNEPKLPGIIAEMRSAPKPGWRTRVVPNKFPAVDYDVAHCEQGQAFYETTSGRGFHEVLIESPRHDRDITFMSEEEVRDVLATYLSRYQALMSEAAVRSVIVFRNHKSVAGASLQHPHSQAIALYTVPPHVRAREAAMLTYYQREEHCLLCEMIAHERNDGSRVVSENEAFVTTVPFAASTPCEMWLLPTRHQADFGGLRGDEVKLLAIALRSALIRLGGALNDPPYNYVIDTAAKDGSGAPHLHWCLRIVPQLTRPAGFELGSDLSINPSLPEEDAAMLRSSPPAITET